MKKVYMVVLVSFCMLISSLMVYNSIVQTNKEQLNDYEETLNEFKKAVNNIEVNSYTTVDETIEIDDDETILINDNETIIVYDNETIDISNYNPIYNEFNPNVNIDNPEPEVNVDVDNYINDSETINIEISDDEVIYVNNTIDNILNNYINNTADNDINVSVSVNGSESDMLKPITIDGSDEILFEVDGDYYGYYAVSGNAKKSMLYRVRENTLYQTADGVLFRIIDSEIITY